MDLYDIILISIIFYGPIWICIHSFCFGPNKNPMAEKFSWKNHLKSQSILTRLRGASQETRLRSSSHSQYWGCQVDTRPFGGDTGGDNQISSLTKFHPPNGSDPYLWKEHGKLENLEILAPENWTNTFWVKDSQHFLDSCSFEEEWNGVGQEVP